METALRSDEGGPPVARRSRGLWVLALGFVAASIFAAARFTPEPATAAAPSNGIAVEKGTITLAEGAAPWKFVRLGTVGMASSRWTDPMPARIAIDEARSSRVGVPLSGRVTRVFVELGQSVAAGDPLFAVASPDLAEFRAARERAGVDLEAARATLARVKAIVASRALPAKEELAAGQQFQQAEVAQRLAESKLSALRVTSETDHDFTVSAPRRGIVVEKNVIVDQQVASDAQNALMVVADLSSVWVLADVFEAEAAAIRPGMPAEVTSPSAPDLVLKGEVELISSVVDPNRHTVPIRVRLGAVQQPLRPNVSARVRFGLAPALEVEAGALVSDGERQYVFVQDGAGRFQRREVVTGSAHEGHVPVLSGLATGETVVEDGALLLDNQVALSD